MRAVNERADGGKRQRATGIALRDDTRWQSISASSADRELEPRAETIETEAPQLYVTIRRR
jgi:hypothetical protein